MLFEAYAEKHQAEEKIRLYHQKYSRSFDAFEDHIQNAAEENFDDYIEWKAYRKIEKAFSKSSSGSRGGPAGMDDDIPVMLLHKSIDKTA